MLDNFAAVYETWDVNASLMKLMHEMYVDRKPMYYSIVPQYCKVVGPAELGD